MNRSATDAYLQQHTCVLSLILKRDAHSHVYKQVFNLYIWNINVFIAGVLVIWLID